MARRLRFNGTNSDVSACPAVHEDLDSGEVIVQGTPVTDPEDVAQLQHLSEGEVAVAVPRHLLVDFAPKDRTRAARIIDLDEFEALFAGFKHTAWRLETRKRYASDEVSDSYREFLETGSSPSERDHPFFTNVRKQTEQGKRYERVRLVDNPPTTGQLYLLDSAKCNSASGEDIRNLWRADAERLRLPEEDFWLFDSRLVALLNFDDDDQLVDVELITEPAEVLRRCMVRDAAWHHAVQYQEFAAGVAAAD
ncbi:hypothetical protein RKE29_18650 [Streptomyces sp. B1866]|uniref:DUF6879 family protein n=1 Tax=Streptomyces sp. B1866 TaxID=3075431 RepID=UPI00288D82F2|nr:DUF6879 family protein [Streptomyces sp. B1866]MDT3398640.1 hypothetical protein [Streptomyces sp. B1866]